VQQNGNALALPLLFHQTVLLTVNRMSTDEWSNLHTRILVRGGH